MIQISKILQSVPIFKMLGKESINFIVERLKFKTFDSEETICKVGDPGDEMFIIISGKVDIVIYPEGDKGQVVATLGPGDYFGEMALLTGEPRSASVITNGPVEAFALQQKDFDVILERYPSISLSMGKIVSKRLSETLKKSSSFQRVEKIEVTAEGPSGKIEDVPIIDLISFAESNSLTGTMTVTNGDKKGVFEFERGALQSVKLGGVSDDKALDDMLAWTSGNFQIKVRPLTLKTEKKESESENVRNKILIVNNSLVVRKVIERAFNGLGYEVNTAQDIASTQKTMESWAPDIIISDIKLPDGSGAELVEVVRELKSVPFIFMTDNSIKPEFEEKLKELGNAEITKTHEVSEIVKLVENMI
jgi:CheY-like chemotaxis protein